MVRVWDKFKQIECPKEDFLSYRFPFALYEHGLLSPLPRILIVDSNLHPVFHELYTTDLVLDLKHCSHLLEDESEYLRGNVWVASGETGHNPDVSGSYQAQGPSFLQYIPVEERSQRVNEDLLQRSGSVWQRDRKREKENERHKHSHGLILGTVQQYHWALDPLEGNV